MSLQKITQAQHKSVDKMDKICYIININDNVLRFVESVRNEGGPMKRVGKQTATLKDIAQKTGYSVNTVSRALRDKEDIAPATRAHIKQVAAEMGHVNNTLASSLRLGYTNSIAVILGDVSNPHFAIMMKEIETRAQQLKYSSFLLNTNEDEEREAQAIQSVLSKNVDGIILCPTQKSTRNIEYLKGLQIPFVLIGRRFEGLDENYVICNDELGGYQATRCLLEQGHRRIVMLHGPTYISSARERLAGYRRAFREFGLVPDEELICEVPVAGQGCADVLQSLDEKKIHYTAIFAFSDIVGWQAWAYMRQKGRRVPESCSIIGFDHIQSRLGLPFHLTSVSSYKGQMSTQAVEMLVERIRGSEPVHPIIIDTKLAEGDTVAPCME